MASSFFGSCVETAGVRRCPRHRGDGQGADAEDLRILCGQTGRFITDDQTYLIEVSASVGGRRAGTFGIKRWRRPETLEEPEKHMPRILLVEDNELNRDMLSRRLDERCGFTAMDGQQGVEMAKTERPDLILMDMSLPVLDGWGATRRIKAEMGLGSSR